MGIRGRRVVIPADTLTRIDTPTIEEGDKVAGSSLLVANRSTVTVELGGESLESEEGFELRENESFPIKTTNWSQGLYALASEDAELQILELGV